MNYISSDDWGKIQKPPMSGRRVRKLCSDKRIEGAELVSGRWIIPKNAKIDIRDRRLKK